MTFLNFSRPTLDDDMLAGIADTVRSLQLTSGPQVIAFEKALSEYHGGRPVRVLTSATAAMEVAFQICGIGPGDEVITSAMTFFSVGNMIRKVGAKTVFVDCDLETRNIDLAQAESAITHATRAIVPTHFAGLACDMECIVDMADGYNLRIVEDAALAIGSSWKDRKIGSFGDLTTFSFHPNKNITTIEGGAIVFADEAEARLAERLRFHGISRLPDGTRDVDVAGGKFNLSDISARLGLAQLARLDEWCAKRRELVEHYFAMLRTSPAVVLPARAPAGEETSHSWNMFCVLLPLDQMTITRKQFMDAMAERGIGTGVSYEVMHLTTLYRNDGYREGMFPNAERVARETVTLPLFPAMTKADVERVCAACAEVIAANAK